MIKNLRGAISEGTESFATTRSGTLWSARLDGSDRLRHYERPGNLLELEVDDDAAFVTFEDPIVGGNGIVRVPLDGGLAEDLVKGESRVTHFATDPEYLFWLGHDGIYRLPKPP